MAETPLGETAPASGSDAGGFGQPVLAEGLTMAYAQVRTRTGSTTATGAGSRPLPRLKLLGGFELSCAQAAIDLPVPAQRLVAFLALRRDSLSRGLIAGNLWLDAPQERALASLRSAVWRARRCDHTLLEVAGERLHLADGVWVDVHRAAAASHRLIDGSPLDDDDLAANRMTNELLPDWYDGWVVLERERLRQLFLHGLEALTRRLSALGRHARAIEAGVAAVQQEPLRESAHRTLIEAHLAEGNRHEALRQYGKYRDIMRDELGLQPSASLRGLLERALGQAPEKAIRPERGHFRRP